PLDVEEELLPLVPDEPDEPLDEPPDEPEEPDEEDDDELLLEHATRTTATAAKARVRIISAGYAGSARGVRLIASCQAGRDAGRVSSQTCDAARAEPSRYWSSPRAVTSLRRLQRRS